MKVINLKTPKDRILSETELLKKLHQQIAEYVGVLTVAQVIGILDMCKDEVKRDQ